MKRVPTDGQRKVELGEEHQAPVIKVHSGHFPRVDALKKLYGSAQLHACHGRRAHLSSHPEPHVAYVALRVGRRIEAAGDGSAVDTACVGNYKI